MEIRGRLAGVAFAGDWHGNHRYAVKAIGYAAKNGVHTLLHAGDFAFTFQRSYLDDLQRACEGAGIRLLAVRGNHDSTDYLRDLTPNAEGFLELRPNVFMIPDGHRFEINGVRFVGLGGAASIDRSRRVPGASWWADELLDEGLVDGLEGECDVVVSHDCPDRVNLPLDPAFGEYFERADPGVLEYCNHNRKTLGRATDRLRPALLVHGHYHMVNADLRALDGGGGTKVVGLNCDGHHLSDNVRTIAQVLATG